MTRRADDDGVDANVVERDYVLAHIVAQLHGVAPAGGGRLVFKGGTALRFVYLDHYRYSADLDFSALDVAPDEALATIEAALTAARHHADLPYLALVAG